MTIWEVNKLKVNFSIATLVVCCLFIIKTTWETGNAWNNLQQFNKDAVEKYSRDSATLHGELGVIIERQTSISGNVRDVQDNIKEIFVLLNNKKNN